MHEDLPDATIRDLAELISHLTRQAIERLRELIRSLGPLVTPPAGMEVRTDDNSEYTGVVVLESNEVTAGVVTRVGPSVPRYSPPAHERPWPSSGRRDEQRGSALAHWAVDGREDEDEPWRR